jgi:hypothetical protein
VSIWAWAPFWSWQWRLAFQACPTALLAHRPLTPATAGSAGIASLAAAALLLASLCGSAAAGKIGRATFFGDDGWSIQ